jgi:serine protease inhibitor ecotin
MEVLGKIEAINPTQQVSEKFRKREFVVETEAGEHSQFIKMELQQDKCSLADKLTIGDRVKVSINLNGRKWQGPQGLQYFNTISAWKIEKL